MTDDLHFLTGPTASGKSEIAAHLAPMMGAEIISVDSMNVYRGMDVGTAKPSSEVRARIRHHLVDIADSSESFSVAQYLSLARQAIGEIRARGRAVLLVGGTPMYMRALLSGIFEGPAADWEMREELYRQGFSNEEGARSLHARLASVDPAAAQRLHPLDVRRVVRAIEVHSKTGAPISELQRQWKDKEGWSAGALIMAIRRWPDDLRDRIDRRVDEMFRQGLVEEVRALLARPGGMSRTARSAVGYAQVIKHIEQGTPLDETVAAVKANTWRISRKQMTWLRHFPGVHWFEANPGESPENPARTLYKLVESWDNQTPVI